MYCVCGLSGIPAAFNAFEMLFSSIGEIGLIVIGLLWVTNKWFDSFIDLLEIVKNNNEDQKDKELPEGLKHMYS